MAKELTLKERNFLNVYLNPDSGCYGNATRSYIKAGYRASNEDIASSEGWKLIRKPKIKKELEKKAMESEFDLRANLKKHIVTLNRKLERIADKEGISREELTAVRLLGEFDGQIGSGNKTAIQINVGESCPACGTLKTAYSLDMQDRVKEILARRTPQAVESTLPPDPSLPADIVKLNEAL